MRKRYGYNRFTGTDITSNDTMRGVIENFRITQQYSRQVSKNMLNNTLISGTRNGLTYVVNADQTVTINGTATYITWLVLNASITLPPGTYTMLSGNTSNDVRVYSATMSGYTDNGKRTTTLTETKTSDISINIPNGTVCNNVVIKPMVLLGTYVASEAYASFNPAPDYPVPILSSGDEGACQLWVHGKNICFTDANDWEGGDYSLVTGNKISSTIRIRLKNLLNVTPSIVHYFNTFYSTSALISFVIRCYDNFGTFISSYGQVFGTTFTPPSNCSKLGIILISGGNVYTSAQLLSFITDGSIKPFICLNSETDKSYAPYTGSITSIDYPDNYVGGSLPNGVFDTDEEMKLGKVVLNGTTNAFSTRYTTDTAGNYRFVASVPQILNQASGTIGNVYCDKLVAKTITNTYAKRVGISVNDVNNQVIIYLEELKEMTTAEANTWLTTHNITIYYQLATPMPITLTKPQIELYEGINYITTTNAVNPSLEVEAWVNRI